MLMPKLTSLLWTTPPGNDSLTRNLPCLINDLVLWIIGKICTFVRTVLTNSMAQCPVRQPCYISLLARENLNIGDIQCIKNSGIEVDVVVGGSIMKVPRSSGRHLQEIR